MGEGSRLHIVTILDCWFPRPGELQDVADTPCERQGNGVMGTKR